MKKTFNIIITLVTLLAFTPLMRAQGTDPIPFPADQSIKFAPAEWNKEYTIDSYSKVAYRKIISQPNSQGIYHILLDAFVTGQEVKLNKAVRSDIVLVLDNSTSMQNSISGGTTRLQALKDAVNAFVDLIDENDTENAPTGSERLGNRIAIVPFGTSINTGNSGRDRVRPFTPLSQADDIKYWVSRLNAPTNNGTNAHLGMEHALSLVTQSTAQIRTVVLFTDGDPGLYGDWNQSTTWDSANSTINYASQIKAKAVDDPDPTKKVIVNVFTVSVIPSPTERTQVYLGKTSSNWDKTTTSMGSSNNWNTSDIWSNGTGNRNTYTDPDTGEVKNETKFAITATNVSQLIQAFETIAESSGGTSEGLGESSIATVDVVSASFVLPKGANESSIRVYTSKCINVPSSGQPVFGPDTLATNRKDKYQPMKKQGEILVPDGNPVDVDDNIVVTLNTSVLSGKKDSISVQGFDYTNNWCGEVLENGIHAGWHGNKVSILIPIKMNPEALGGVGVDTNGEGSGIYVDGENKFPFTSPNVNLPVNIIINKQGLDVGESSKFTIYRSIDKTNWTPVTSVFVTRHSGQTSNEPRTRIEGLPATDKNNNEYVYKVVEDNWSWSYTLTSERELLSDENDNPFRFTNQKKDKIDTKIRHAESKATNSFKTGGGAEYDDSKGNGRDVITVTAGSN